MHFANQQQSGTYRSEGYLAQAAAPLDQRELVSHSIELVQHLSRMHAGQATRSPHTSRLGTNRNVVCCKDIDDELIETLILAGKLDTHNKLTESFSGRHHKSQNTN